MNAAERKSIRAAEKAAQLREQQRINFVVAAMSTEAGRRYFYDLLARCHVFAADYTSDTHLASRIEGERNIGLGIYLDIVTHCADSFVVMMKEANIQEILNDRRTATEQPGSPDGDGGTEGADDNDEPDGEPYHL